MIIHINDELESLKNTYISDSIYDDGWIEEELPIYENTLNKLFNGQGKYYV